MQKYCSNKIFTPTLTNWKTRAMAKEFVSGRGKYFCRGCNESELFSALDLGELPIANELWPTEHELEEVFPLHLRICTACGLGQVEDVVTPSRLFRDYRYLSSMSSVFVAHAKEYATSTAIRLDLQPKDWVLEIGSNDGYLLKHFIELGVDVLGIEPAENVAKIATQSGIPLVSEFFGVDLAGSLIENRGFPRLVVANNVMAHVPDIQDFIGGLAKVAGPNTVISIENPSLINFLEKNQFDTIYHEHYSYLTAHSVAHIVENFGLELFDLEKIPTHGGSNRYWLRSVSSTEPKSETVDLSIESEISSGLFDRESWHAFSDEVKKTLSDFRAWLESSFSEGKKVVGYGAAAKASTLLNGAGVEKEWLVAIADASHEKQGRFMPAEGIPIISPQKMFELKPTDVIIFPWNIQDELIQLIKGRSQTDTRIWRVIPHLEQIV